MEVPSAADIGEEMKHELTDLNQQQNDKAVVDAVAKEPATKTVKITEPEKYQSQEIENFQSENVENELKFQNNQNQVILFEESTIRIESHAMSRLSEQVLNVQLSLT